MGSEQASPYPHAHHNPIFPPQRSLPMIKNKTITTPPHFDANQTHSTHTKLIKKSQQDHGRCELQCGRPQARRCGAAVCQRLARGGKARAGRPGQGPAVGASRPSGRLRRHGCHRLRKCQRLRRVPREEQAQQGAERQEEGGHQRRQLRTRLHCAVRQLQVPLQLHRLPGPRQAEESTVHLRRPRDRVRGKGEVQVRIQRLLEMVKLNHWPRNMASADVIRVCQCVYLDVQTAEVFRL